MKTFTPGPWFEGTGWVGAGKQPHPTVICRVENYPYGETEPNLRLIAAAPDLLEALADLLDACPVSCEDTRLIDAQRRAESAIVKAEGKVQS